MKQRIALDLLVNILHAGEVDMTIQIPKLGVLPLRIHDNPIKIEQSRYTFR
jgi:hypothetical protein